MPTVSTETQGPDSILGFITGSSVNFWFMHSVLNLFKNDAQNRFNADWLLCFGPYIHANRNQIQRPVHGHRARLAALRGQRHGLHAG